MALDTASGSRNSTYANPFGLSNLSCKIVTRFTVPQLANALAKSSGFALYSTCPTNTLRASASCFFAASSSGFACSLAVMASSTFSCSSLSFAASSSISLSRRCIASISGSTSPAPACVKGDDAFSVVSRPSRARSSGYARESSIQCARIRSRIMKIIGESSPVARVSRAQRSHERAYLDVHLIRLFLTRRRHGVPSHARPCEVISRANRDFRPGTLVGAAGYGTRATRSTTHERNERNPEINVSSITSARRCPIARCVTRR